MTIEWRYTEEQNVGVLSVAGYLGPAAVHRFSGAVGWVLARGDGPVILDLTGLRAWSIEGRRAVAEAARSLAAHGRSLELSAIPAGPPFANRHCLDVPVHPDLSAARATHATRRAETADRATSWRRLVCLAAEAAGAGRH
ncbi:STAS domain-containing protein [Streptomyces sp. NPDC048362]|uniref:STAS domain-containing protein n=1 Tax=Streptomyces sp. NPDC048362 TaxID=3365539 RepID=UPI00371977BD